MGTLYTSKTTGTPNKYLSIVHNLITLYLKNKDMNSICR